MPKLHLKRTPEEEISHQQRKKKRKEHYRKRGAAIDHHQQRTHASSSKPHHADLNNAGASWKWTSSDEDVPSEYKLRSSKAAPYDDRIHSEEPDYNTFRAEFEEQLFREKMFDALGDDERLDSIETQLNDFIHVPDRWRSTSTSGGKARDLYDEDDFLKLNPSALDEEEYAEWIRLGMYRKTHAAEYQEQLRRKADIAARRTEEKARKAEAKRLEKEAEEERKHRKWEKDNHRWDYARAEYDARWKVLLEEASDSTSSGMLEFHDIPWPIISAYEEKTSKRHATPVSRKPVTSEDLTKDAITMFLLPTNHEGKKERREKLRETFLRFHPDKFDGRFMKRIKSSDHDVVREAITQVSRVLTHLMGKGS